MARKLASVQKIVDIKPIEGKDRIVLATIEGFKVIVGKEMQVGDLVVYIEIDSVLPDRPEFEQARKRSNRIRTMKMGNVYSEGIAYPISILPNGNWKEGDDVTALLGIVKYDEYAGEEPIGVSNLSKKKNNWFQRIWYRIFGYPKRKKGGFSTLISKTDETRCLDGNTKILTEVGELRIADIVNNKKNVKVASVSDDGKVEWMNILDYQKFPAEKEYMEIKYPFHPFTNRNKTIKCTNDHRFLTDSGYKRADELTLMDKVGYIENTYSEDIIPLIYGMLLGDGTLSIDKRSNGIANKSRSIRLSFTQGEKQTEYFNYKVHLLNSEYVTTQEQKSGYVPNNKVNVCSIPNDYLIMQSLYDDKSIDEDGHLVLTEKFCEKLTPLSLAIWYMDDGTCRHLNNEVYKSNTKQSPAIEISSNSFNLEEVELLSKVLWKFNIDNSIKTINRNGKTYLANYITVKGTPDFMRLIAPYVPENMRYKLTDEIRNSISFNQLDSFKKEKHIIFDKILSISKIEISKYSHGKTFYDLEIEKNHNFISGGIISHNCQNIPEVLNYKEPVCVSQKIDGQSASYTIERTFFGHKFNVYSRNFNVGRDNSNYWKVADMYDMEERMELMMNDMGVKWVAVQGEVAGPGIQKNPEGLKDIDFFVFNIITPNGRLGNKEMVEVCSKYGLTTVPMISYDYILPNTVDEMLAYATGPSLINPNVLREGVVVRSQDGKHSFKAVSPEYLVKHGK